jgi:hypothetical protein
VPQRLAETSRGEGQPLDVHGKRLIDCYDQLVGILRNRLGQNHAHLLAQPRVQPSGAIQWYTPLAGAVVRAEALPPEDRQRLQDRAERILGDIQGVANDIRSEGAAGQMIADMLRAAAQLAPEAPLFSVDGKPVAILWGHRSTDAPPLVTPTDAVSARRAATPSSTVPVQPEPAVPANTQPEVVAAKIPEASDGAAAKRRRMLVLAACAGVIALLALLFGLRQFVFTDHVTAASADDLDTKIAEVESRNRVLEAEIARAKDKGKGPAVKCVPEPKK